MLHRMALLAVVMSGTLCGLVEAAGDDSQRGLSAGQLAVQEEGNAQWKLIEGQLPFPKRPGFGSRPRCDSPVAGDRRVPCGS